MQNSSILMFIRNYVFERISDCKIAAEVFDNIWLNLPGIIDNEIQAKVYLDAYFNYLPYSFLNKMPPKKNSLDKLERAVLVIDDKKLISTIRKIYPDILQTMDDKIKFINAVMDSIRTAKNI